MMLGIHLAAAIASDILLVLSGLISIAYLVQDRRLREKQLASVFLQRLPALHTMERTQSTFLTLAFIMMSIGIIAGSLLAKQLWGEMWFLDPRHVWSVATWLLFAFVLFARLSVGWRGRKATWVTLIGISFVLAGIVVLHYAQITKHSSPYEVLNYE